MIKLILFCTHNSLKQNYLGSNKVIDFINVDKNAKIIVAMSGGVDSSLTLALLQEAGYTNIVGITYVLYDNDIERGIIRKDVTALEDAKKVADLFNIPHVAIESLKDSFMQEVITPFLDGYSKGITLNPCIRCNRFIKFGAMFNELTKLEGDILVTGHYIKWLPGETGLGEIYAGVDGRDQSYFLSQVRREVLQKVRFPLATYNKDLVRAEASRFGIHVAEKKSSSGICFNGKDSYANIVSHTFTSDTKGNIKTVDGKILATHEGIHHFTVGQRKGIGISGTEEPYFVIDINPNTFDVTVGAKEHLATREVILSDVNWLGDEPFTTKMTLLAKVRASQPPIIAEIIPMDNNQCKVIFSKDVYGVAKGQTCAFYKEVGNYKRLMGGGYI